MANRILPFAADRHFDPASTYDHDASPKALDMFWSVAGVLFVAAATTIVVGEDWPQRLVAPTEAEAAESTAPAGALVAPRLNVVALTADIHAARLSTEDVRQLQDRLAQLGYAPGKVDGIAGTRTLDALNAYRAAQSMAPADAVDYGTVGALLD